MLLILLHHRIANVILALQDPKSLLFILKVSHDLANDNFSFEIWKVFSSKAETKEKKPEYLYGAEQLIISLQKSDICVRKSQFKVANAFLSNETSIFSKKYRLLQINMGEGKSAVIMPIAMCIVANGDNL